MSCTRLISVLNILYASALFRTLCVLVFEFLINAEKTYATTVLCISFFENERQSQELVTLKNEPLTVVVDLSDHPRFYLITAKWKTSVANTTSSISRTIRRVTILRWTSFVSIGFPLPSACDLIFTILANTHFNDALNSWPYSRTTHTAPDRNIESESFLLLADKCPWKLRIDKGHGMLNSFSSKQVWCSFRFPGEAIHAIIVSLCDDSVKSFTRFSATHDRSSLFLSNNSSRIQVRQDQFRKIPVSRYSSCRRFTKLKFHRS